MLLTEMVKDLKNSLYMKTKDATGKTKDASQAEYSEQRRRLERLLKQAQQNGDTEEAKEIQEDINDLIKNGVEDSKTTDMPNYYDLIVMCSRDINNVKGNKGLAQRQIERLLEYRKIPFDENAFNTAFEEFKKAPASKQAFQKGPKNE